MVPEMGTERAYPRTALQGPTGRFGLVGPLTTAMECTLGLACALQVGGYRLSATNRVVAISSGALPMQRRRAGGGVPLKKKKKDVT